MVASAMQLSILQNVVECYRDATVLNQQVLLGNGKLSCPFRYEIEVLGPAHLYQIENSAYRSTSPKTISCVPIIVTTSASMWFLAIKSSPCR